jgi:hypothetical protein
VGFRFTFVRGDCFLKTCPMITDEHTNQFLETYGRAMLSWQAVEFRLLLLFLAIIRAHDQHIASAVYHAVTNINTRIEMITEGLKVALPESAPQQEWTKLRKKIGRHAAKRNLLAHYTVTTHIPQHGSITLRLARSVFDTRDKERHGIDLRQLEEYERLFRQLAAVIDGFTAKISASLPQSKTEVSAS